MRLIGDALEHLEVSSKTLLSSSEDVPADERTAEFQECFVNVSTPLEARAQTAEIMEPGVRTFDQPTILAEPAPVFGPALRDHGPDAAVTQRTSVSRGIVAAIGVDDAGLLKWSTTDTANRRNCINERQQLRNVVGVRAGQDRHWPLQGCGAWNQGAHGRRIDRSV